jgi:Holliday junction resolvase
MSNKGYSLEREIEILFVKIEGTSLDVPFFKRSHRVSFSGAMRGEKGDVVGLFSFLKFPLLVECKSRCIKNKKDQIIYLEEEWLPKITEEAKSIGALPLLIVSFKRKQLKRIWVVMYKNHFEILFGKISNIPGVKLKKGKKNIVLSYNIMKDYELFQFENLIIFVLEKLVDRLKEIRDGMRKV